jgi:hypothetical protein
VDEQSFEPFEEMLPLPDDDDDDDDDDEEERHAFSDEEFMDEHEPDEEGETDSEEERDPEYDSSDDEDQDVDENGVFKYKKVDPLLHYAHIQRYLMDGDELKTLPNGDPMTVNRFLMMALALHAFRNESNDPFY